MRNRTCRPTFRATTSIPDRSAPREKTLPAPDPEAELTEQPLEETFPDEAEEALDDVCDEAEEEDEADDTEEEDDDKIN